MFCTAEARRVLAAVWVVLLALFSGAAFAANLAANGDFESWTSGSPDSWRWYSVGGADGTLAQVSAAGTHTSGAYGALLSWSNNNTGDSGLDKWDNRIPMSQQHVYRMLVDVKYNSGEPRLRSVMQVFDSTGAQVWAPERQWGSYLTSQFQTIGQNYTPIPGEVALSVRYDVGGASGNASSTYVDNVRIEDVTTSGNRLINGDFENSATQPISWRFFNVGSPAAAASCSLSSDAQSGSHAVLLTVTAPPVAGDAGLDIWDDQIGVVPGENLEVSFRAKRVGDASSARLWCSVTEVDLNGSPIADHYFPVDPGSTAYGTFTNTIVTRNDAAFAVIGFRIMDDSRAHQAGSYLIDNVYAGAATNLLSNGNFESWSNGIPDHWRWYALFGADGAIAQTGAPGTFTSGSSGVVLTWNNNAGDSSLDRWGTFVPVTPDHIYRLKVDAKHSSGEKAFRTGMLVLSDSTPTRQDLTSWGASLTSSFQTFSRELLIAPNENNMSIRFDVANGGSGSSAYIDNAVLEDVTYGNRLYNGSFENSSTQLLQWRFFNVGAGASATLSSDAQSGARAAQLTVTSTSGAVDVGLDTWNDAICVFPYEPLQATFSAKKLSGAADTGILCEVIEFNASGTPVRSDRFFVAPTTGAYTQFAQTFRLASNAAAASIGFRITDSAGNLRTGSFLIDGVALGASTVTEAPVSILQAKSKPLGTVFSISGVPVSRILDINTFYIESDDRVTGIRVQKASHGLQDDGLRASITGFAWVDLNGEYYIDASAVSPAGNGSVAPLGMTGKSFPGGVGLDTTGLLVRTCGRVLEVDPSSNPSWFVIDDGSGVPIRCERNAAVTIDPTWQYVVVTGICSREKSGDVINPRIFVCNQSDIVKLY